MGPVLSRPGLRLAIAALVVTGAALALSACSTQPGGNANVIAGKQLFVQKCGSCHVLARAQTKGTTGPNLDEAFQRSIKDGMERSGVRGVVHGWILHPNQNGVMPAKLVTGEKAQDVAAYVAQSAAAGG
ncbi:MAG TPA: c-type cytochrome, partial [Solirubrobacteraceae bacterium]